MKSPHPLAATVLSASLLVAPSLLAADSAKKPKAPPAAPLPAIPATDAPAALPAVVAVVEGVEIKGPELDQTFNGFLSSRRIPPDGLPPAEKARGYRMVLEEMIKEKLIASRAGAVKVSEEEVSDAFKKFTANLGPEEEVKKQIEASGQSVDTIRANIRASIQQDHWLAAEVEKAGGVSDKDAEDFYQKNTDKFVAPREVRASHILIRVAADEKPEVVVEKQKAAQAIASRVKKGEDFGKLAKELSEDPSAKENSGDLDFFRKEQMVPEFSDAAFAMKQGDISDPVRSQFGYHVIKVTDRREPETMSLEKVKPKLLAFLKGQKAEALKEEIRKKAEVKINLPAPLPDVAAPAGAPAATPPAPK